jgi:hypothetical protein
MWGGGSKMVTKQSPPPPQEAQLSPKSGDSCGITSPHHEVPEDTNRAQEGTNRPQEGTKGVTWPVGCRVRGRHFPAYSSINGYNKKPFSQIRGGKPSSTLLHCQSLPTSFPCAVRSEYPASIVALLYISRGRGISVSPELQTLYLQICIGLFQR